MADVNGISDLLKQIAYYQSGGTAPGQSLADKMGRVQDIASGYEHDVKDIGDIVKQRLEAKQLKLGQTPYYKFDQSLPQDPGVVDKAQADSDLAQKNYTQAFQAQRDTAGTAPDPGQQPQAYANPYKAYETANGFNPRLPLSTIKEVAQAKALSDPGTVLFTDQTGTKFGRFPSSETPYPYTGISKKQAPTILSGQGKAQMQIDAANSRENAIVPTMTPDEGLAAGGVPKNSKVIKPSTDDAKHDSDIAKAAMILSNQIRTDPTLNHLKDEGVGNDELQVLSKLVSEGNTVAAAGVGSKMARVMGEGSRLTDKDVTRYVGSGKLSQRAADTLSRWMAGTPSQATQEEVAQIASVLRLSYNKAVQNIHNDYVKKFSVNYKISPDEAAARLAVPYVPDATEQTPAKTANNDPLGLFK